jgi:hypothetical protein
MERGGGRDQLSASIQAGGKSTEGIARGIRIVPRHGDREQARILHHHARPRTQCSDQLSYVFIHWQVPPPPTHVARGLEVQTQLWRLRAQSTFALSLARFDWVPNLDFRLDFVREQSGSAHVNRSQ